MRKKEGEGERGGEKRRKEERIWRGATVSCFLLHEKIPPSQKSARVESGELAERQEAAVEVLASEPGRSVMLKGAARGGRARRISEGPRPWAWKP
jgi:hypothetical protein